VGEVGGVGVVGVTGSDPELSWTSMASLELKELPAKDPEWQWYWFVLV
jgi:hypothetical protein